MQHSPIFPRGQVNAVAVEARRARVMVVRVFIFVLFS
jgi:hypothetical protein